MFFITTTLGWFGSIAPAGNSADNVHGYLNETIFETINLAVYHCCLVICGNW